MKRKNVKVWNSGGVANKKYTENDKGVFDYNFTNKKISGYCGFRDFDGTQKDIVCLGAAQTAGRFVNYPFPALIENNTEYSVANLGWGAVGDWQYNTSEFLDYINSSKLCIYQINSGRSTRRFTEIFDLDPRCDLLRRLDRIRGIFDNDFQSFKTKFYENKKQYLDDSKNLIQQITVPILFVYVSHTDLKYRAECKFDLNKHEAREILYNFPQLVTKEMVEELVEDNPLGCFTHKIVTKLPSPIIDNQSYQKHHLFETDDYYPDQETHYKIAEYLIPKIEHELYRESSVKFRMGEWYDKKFILNEFDWDDIENRNYISRTENSRWKEWIARFKNLSLASNNPGMILDSQDVFVHEDFIKEGRVYDCSLGDRAEIPVATHNRKHDCKNSILFPIDDTYNVMTGNITESDRYTWKKKKNEVVWRGKLTGKDLDGRGKERSKDIEKNIKSFPRFAAVKMWCDKHNIKFIDEYSENRPPNLIKNDEWFKRCTTKPHLQKNIEYIKKHLKNNNMIGSYMHFYEEMLQYKYILSLDGNDWSSSVPWILKSNSLMISPIPKWHNVLNFRLKPWVHYVPLRDDISDLDNKLMWCSLNQAQCQGIVKRANEYISHFNEEEERKIEKRIFEKLYENAYVLNPSSVKKYNISNQHVKEQEKTDISYVKVGNGNKKLIVSFASNKDFERKRHLMRLKYKHNNFDVLYLRNKDEWYLGELNGIGTDIWHTIEFFKKEFAKYDEVLCTGISSGGYASLLFGTLLNVDKVIALQPQTDLEYTANHLPANNLGGINLRKFAKDCPARWKQYNNILNVLMKNGTLRTDIEIIPWIEEPKEDPSHKVLHCDHQCDSITTWLTVTKTLEDNLIEFIE